jgi:hypothetical protein
VFANVGESPKGTPVKLATWLNLNIDHSPKHANENNSLSKELSHVTKVDLNFSENGVLTITANGEGIHRKWSFEKSKGQLKCKNGILKIHLSGDGSGDNVAAYESDTLELQMVGNDLVVNKRESSAGIILLIPFWGGESLWGRFKLETNQ